jgi:hypothetical protein
MYGNSSGNVLFLILIAVVLFAALSYSVTSSSRSGSGNSNREIDKTSIAQMQVLPNAVRNAITRMTLNGASINDINFLTPSQFSVHPTNVQNNSVFHPNGGGVAVSDILGDPIGTYPRLVDDACTAGQGWGFPDGTTLWWVGVGKLNQIGVTQTGANTDNAEIVMALFCIKKSVCDAINAQAGIATLPSFSVDYFPDSGQIAGSSLTFSSLGSTGRIFGRTSGGGAVAGSGPMSGKPFGCYSYTGSPQTYLYYQTVYEQ